MDPRTGTTDTAIGLVLGTLDYMSPEQVRGLAIDRRTDIFSFGTMLYEMITGRLPFAGASRTDTVYRITQTQPDPISRHAYDVPPDLDRIARKCLEKEASRRYQSARDLLVDLSGLRRDSGSMPAPAAPAAVALSRGQRLALVVMAVGLLLAIAAAVTISLRPAVDVVDSLAVVPITTSDPGTREAAVTRAVATSLVNSLSLMPALTLAPRQTSFAAGARRDYLDNIRGMNVHAALLVQVEQVGDSVVLLIDLVDLLHEKQMWFHQATHKLAEIEVSHQTISATVADQLELRLDADAKHDVEVYQLYQRGRASADNRSVPDLRRALGFYEQALVKDPDYAPAHAGKAYALNMLQTYSALRPEEAFPQARAAARRALAIDGDLAQAHTQLAWVLFRWEWNLNAAEEEFRKAIALDANEAQAHHWLSNLLAVTGRFDEALESLKRAQEIDPLSAVISAESARLLYVAGRYQEAVTESQRLVAARRDAFMSYRYLGLALEQLGRFSEAIDAFTTALRIESADSSLLKAELGHAYGRAGRTIEAGQVLAELYAQRGKSYVSPFSLAVVTAGLGDAGTTLQWLEVAVREKANQLVWLNVDPRFDFLRKDQRFKAVLEAIGFVE